LRSKSSGPWSHPARACHLLVGWKGFVYQRTVPDDALLVKVTARMWSWHFDYENGAGSDVLTVPVGQAGEARDHLRGRSAQPLHPRLPGEEDCVPGMETYLWFRPDRTGTYDLFCSEYCGTGHSSMITTVQVLSMRSSPAGTGGHVPRR